MGIRDWFTKRPQVLGKVRFPSPEYPTATDAITALVEANGQSGDDSSWVSFHGLNSNQNFVIQIQGDQINLCKQEVDIAALLIAQGHLQLSTRVFPRGRKQNDQSCWTVSNATPVEIALIVDALFITAFGLGPGYQLTGDRDV